MLQDEQEVQDHLTEQRMGEEGTAELSFKAMMMLARKYAIRYAKKDLVGSLHGFYPLKSGLVSKPSS